MNVNTTYSATGSAAAYYFKSASTLNLQAGSMINGSTITSAISCITESTCETKLLAVAAKANGGWYVYIPTGTYGQVAATGDENACLALMSSSSVATSSSSSSIATVTLSITSNGYPAKQSVPSGTCFNVVGTWANQYYIPTIKMQCEGSTGITITYKTASLSGNNSISMDIDKPYYTITSATFFKNICVTVTGASTISCGLTN